MVTSAVLDPARLDAVRRSGMLDTPREEAFDHLAALASELLDAPYAFITVVDDSRSFWKSCIGIDGPDAPRQNPVEESFCQYVIGTGSELIVGDVTADPLTADNPSIASMGVAAWAGFPVLAATGEVLGTFCVVDIIVRTWSPRDVDVLRVLAHAAATEISLRVVLDHERHARVEATQHSAATSARYAELLEAASEGIYGLDADGRTTFLNAAASRMLGYRSDELMGLAQHALIHHSHRSGEALALEDCRMRHALLAGEVRRADDEVFWRKDGTCFPVAYVATPVRQGEQITGVVVTFTDLSDRIARDQLQAAAAAAESQLAGQRAALLELQETMQPPPLRLPAVELACCYVPAEGAAAGGDLYDWVELPDGSIHISVVDVVGKGVVAAKDALAVTHALRLIALAGVDVGSLVSRADALLHKGFPDLAATAILARYQPATGLLRVACGGHPPALLIDGPTATYLETSGRAIGWPNSGSDDVVEVVLPVGASLLLYTDGLIEAQRDIIQGLADLQAAAIQLGALPADELAIALVDNVLSDAHRHDDTLALVLRRHS